MDRMHMASTTSPVAVPAGPSTTVTAQTFIIVALTLLAYYILRFVYSVYIYPFHVSPLRHLPTPKENHHWIMGQMLNLLTTPWIPYLYRTWSRDCPDSPFLRILKIGNSETLIPNTIDAYREVLQTKNDCFIKSEESRIGAAMVIGDGLPWAHGESHRQRRAVLNKLFSAPRMKACAPKIRAKARQLAKSVAAKQGASGEAVMIETDIWKAVLDVAGIKSLGVDLNHLATDDSPLHDIFSTTMRPTIRGHIIRWIVAHMPFRECLPLEACSEFVRKCARARTFLRGHVRRAREACQRGEKASSPSSEDVSVLQAMVEQDGLWDDSEIMEYILNFIVLGHDTTACTLVWAIDLLARRNDIQERLRSEIAALEDQTWSEIDRLQYLENFMREALRVYCPVGWIPMEAACDVEIAGVPVPKGTSFNLSPAMVNLKPEIWGQDASAFDPDRWNHLQGEAGNAYAFATFHNGPRVCIGKALAMMEIKMVIVELVTRFRLEATHEGEMGLETPSFTLKPKERLTVRLREL